jgi:hypothetical protein
MTSRARARVAGMSARHNGHADLIRESLDGLVGH